MAATAYPAVQELGEQNDNQDNTADAATDGVDDARALHAGALRGVGLGAQQPVPVPHHRGLAQGEGNEDPDDVELDEPGDFGVVGQDQDTRRARQDEDAIAVGQPVAAGMQLSRQEPIARQDRPQDREAVEGGVGGQDQDQPGDDRDQDHTGAKAVEDRLGHLAHDRVLNVILTDRHPVT